MSKRKRSRRPGGHPAKVAARRDRDTARPGDIVRRVTSEADRLESQLDAELWASALLGAFWEEGKAAPLAVATSDDFTREIGGPLIEALSRRGGRGAGIALAAIGAVDDGELGLLARRLAGEWSSDELPSWTAHLGEAEIVGAAVMHEDVFDDASTVFLEARGHDGDRHATGVLIDNNLGGMARDIFLADSVDRVAEVMAEHPQPEAGLRLARIEPGVAAGRIHAALELTDITLDPPVSDDYVGMRAFALRRADDTPKLVAPEPRPEVPAEERDALRDEFLASREGDEFAADGDEAFVASLVIDFCANYVDGRPLRWSPVVVELFMADWFPRKVIADPGVTEVLPAVLDAWVRFAGRRRGTPDWAIAETQAAIGRWRHALTEHRDADVDDPIGSLIHTMRVAGVDIHDQAALDAFLAGWNAPRTLS